MNSWGRLGICACVSIVGHYTLTTLLELLPPSEAATKSPPVEIRVIVPPPVQALPPPPEPEPEPEKPPEPKKPEPTPPKQPATKTTTQPKTPVHDVAPVDTPPTEHSVTTEPTTTTPVYGVTMESTSQGGKGPAVPVGNTTSPGVKPGEPEKGPVAPLAAPVAAYEVTKMPLPQGRCAGKYTDEARAAGIEGVVILDLIVDETGHARDITVVERLEHGLTEAAIAALRACTFTPGEKGGTKVPVRVRGFKIRFVMDSP